MISEKNFDRIKKICLFALPILIVLAIVCSVCGFMSIGGEKDTTTVTASKNDDSGDDADALAKYPTRCALNTKLPELYFTDKDSKEVNLSDYKGKTVVLLFWASYCPYCKKELEKCSEFKNIIDKKGDVVFLLADKLDNKKETREKANDYIKSQQIPFPTLFDDKLQTYDMLGIKLIPTTLFIDKNGYLRHISIDNYSASELESMIDYTKSCGTSASLKFIKSSLTNADGGIKTNFKNDLGKTNADDVLAESEGLIALYNAKSGNKADFEKTWGFVKSKMFKNNLAAWSLAKDGKKANANAVIDDLRFVRALSEANKNFTGYDDELKTYASAIYKYNTNNNRLIDFYDFGTKKGAQTLKLCYADFEALDELTKQEPNFAKVRQNALDAVSGGYIGDNFPFYRNSYNYSDKKYDDTKLNMAEEMETVLHLARAGCLKPETHDFLKKAVDGEGIFATYEINGNVPTDGKFESTAVYALTAETARALGDKELESKSLQKMEKMRIFDTASQFDGAFGNKDGSGIYSFDQLTALLTYKDIGGAAANGL